ncbi:MAG TPA: GNAT family N-acetyltransferase [Actinoplanes sp.]|nr:GNAT family N-acetyltransferase [Actinoplanes sp.]
MQLHSGDLGWNWSLGTQTMVDALRVWSRDEEVSAVGMQDAPGLFRMAIAPAVADDDKFAQRVLDDLDRAGATVVEARFGDALRGLLERDRWLADKPWSPLCRDLTAPVEECGLRIEVVGEHNVRDRVAVQRASFANSTFTEQRWRTMAATPAYRNGRCLVGYDGAGAAVATVTVWSAGPGRPGLLEPLGVHRDHQRRGHGRAITLAAAAALREMGASAATVCTSSSNVAAVATYASAGFERLAESADFRKPA